MLAEREYVASLRRRQFAERDDDRHRGRQPVRGMEIVAASMYAVKIHEYWNRPPMSATTVGRVVARIVLSS
jgi:hypothetical protein